MLAPWIALCIDGVKSDLDFCACDMAATQSGLLTSLIELLTPTAALLTIVIELWNMTSVTIRLFSVIDLVILVFVALICFMELKSERLGDRGLSLSAFFLLWPFLVLLGLAVAAPVMSLLGIVFIPWRTNTRDWWAGMGIALAGIVVTGLLAWRLVLLTKPRLRT